MVAWQIHKGETHFISLERRSSKNGYKTSAKLADMSNERKKGPPKGKNLIA